MRTLGLLLVVAGSLVVVLVLDQHLDELRDQMSELVALVDVVIAVLRIALAVVILAELFVQQAVAIIVDIITDFFCKRVYLWIIIITVKAPTTTSALTMSIIVLVDTSTSPCACTYLIPT